MFTLLVAKLWRVIALAALLFFGLASIGAPRLHAQVEVGGAFPTSPGEVSPAALSVIAPVIPLTDVQTIAIGSGYKCALTTDGVVSCWSLVLSEMPIVVTGLGEHVKAISAGYNHACAVTAQGGVKCWGNNSRGQLGDGTTAARFGVVDVVGLASGVQAISAHQDHTCALTAAGGVKCWGDNGAGQLGDGTTELRPSPVAVVGMSSGVRTIAAGDYHTCAITVQGAAFCWGANFEGQLGDGTTEDRLKPVAVNGLGTNVQAIAVGGTHTCAVTGPASPDGALFCWGANDAQQLGDGTTVTRLTPVAVSLGAAVHAVAAGYQFTCAAVGDGAKCWGANWNGQLGNATAGILSDPVAVDRLDGPVRTLVADLYGGCVLLTSGAVQCWGQYSGVTKQVHPAVVPGLPSGILSTSLGAEHACALAAGGVPYCWGDNRFGQLGTGDTGWPHAAAVVTALGSGVQALASSFGFSCAVTAGGAVQCWGGNASGQLGDGTTNPHSLPAPVSGLGAGAMSVAVGGDLETDGIANPAVKGHACALLADGSLQCWGGNSWGQLGNGTLMDQFTPVTVNLLRGRTQTVAAGTNFTCALNSGGGVQCWGGNSVGQLGDGTDVGVRELPTDVVGLTRGVRSIAVGAGHTCALTEQGTVKCWGFNGWGQLGDGTTQNRSTPVDVMRLGGSVQAIAAGEHHTCALLVTGAVRCWGANWSGQLGDGTLTDYLTPVTVSALDGAVVSIAAAGDYSCAVTTVGSSTQGTLQCWGSNEYDQLGWSRTLAAYVPAAARPYMYLPQIALWQP
jgi:alpha-tubulin suppressor-like RCC1 family protein